MLIKTKKDNLKKMDSQMVYIIIYTLAKKSQKKN
jgi:hypothetical protein